MVYQHPDLSTTIPTMATQDKGILVDSEGVVSLALLEDVKISGLTQKEAAKKIEVGYDEFLNYAKVKPKKALIVIVSFISILVLMIFISFFREFLKGTKEKGA